MSVDVKSLVSISEGQEVTAGVVIRALGHVFGMELPELEVERCSIDATYFRGSPDMDVPDEEQFMERIFVEGFNDWQTVLCALCDHAYPEVCDISAEASARILFHELGDKFDVYIVGGTFGEQSIYHNWVMAVSKEVRVVYYIDLTYIQFMPNSLTEVRCKSSDCKEFIIRNYSDLRKKVMEDISSVDFPPAIIRVGAKGSDQWHPFSYYRVKSFVSTTDEERK